MSRAAVLALAATASAGCTNFDPPPPPPFTVSVVVESDPGVPVPGANVVRGDRTLGTTGADGRAPIVLHGADGQAYAANVRCPAGFTSPKEPITLRVSRMSDGSKRPELRVACPPATRHVVIAVKADGGADLPVRYLDQVVARTDASGAAHFAVEAPPGTQLRVTLDTSEKGNERLRPVSPSVPFTIADHDDVFLFEQKFSLEKKVVHHKKQQKIVCLTCGKT